jgi:hypothetical protein
MSDVTDEAMEKFAKILVFNCVRDTFLEDIHSGEEKFGNQEMKKLMREITNKVYTFLKLQNDPNFFSLMAQKYPDTWDKAELDNEFIEALRMTSGHSDR